MPENMKYNAEKKYEIWGRKIWDTVRKKYEILYRTKYEIWGRKILNTVQKNIKYGAENIVQNNIK